MSGHDAKPFQLRVPADAVPNAERVLADAGMDELVDVVADEPIPGVTVLEGVVAYDDPDD